MVTTHRFRDDPRQGTVAGTADRFSRRVNAHAKRPHIPPPHGAPAVHKYKFAEQYRPADPTFTGVFLILVAKAPALIWDVVTSTSSVPHVRRKALSPHARRAPRPQAGRPHCEEGQCFVVRSGVPALDRLTEPLGDAHGIDRLAKLCERWGQTSWACFGLTRKGQIRTGFHYQYSSYQVEDSRHLLFTRGTALDAVHPELLDQTRRWRWPRR